jgi:hypothetical protein
MSEARDSINNRRAGAAGLPVESFGATLTRTIALLSCLSLVSCALPGVVQRQSVEYNEAAAGIANQLALLNIMRAEEGLPILYTSISRLSGSTVVTAGGRFNAQIKDASPTDTTPCYQHEEWRCTASGWSKTGSAC